MKKEKLKTLTVGHPCQPLCSSFFLLVPQWKHCRHDRASLCPPLLLPRAVAPLVDKKDLRRACSLSPPHFSPCPNPNPSGAMAVT